MTLDEIYAAHGVTDSQKSSDVSVSTLPTSIDAMYAMNPKDLKKAKPSTSLPPEDTGEGDLSTLENLARNVQLGYTYGTRQAKRFMSPAEQEKALQYTQENPWSGGAAQMLGSLGNPVFAAGGLLAQAGSKAIPALQALERAPGIGAALKNLALRLGVNAGIGGGAALSETGSPSDAASAAYKSLGPQLLLEAATPALRLGGRLAAHPIETFTKPAQTLETVAPAVGETLAGKAMKNFPETRRFYERGPQIQEAEKVLTQEPQPTAEFMGPESQQAAQSIQNERVRLAGQAGTQMEAQVQNPISKTIRDLGSRFDEVSRPIVDGPRGKMPVDTSEVVDLIDKKLATASGIKDPMLMQRLKSFRDRLVTNVDEIDGKAPTEYTEIPLSDYIKAAKEWGFPSQDSGSARFSRMIRGKMSKNLRNQAAPNAALGTTGDPELQKLTDVMEAYSNARNPLDDLHKAIKTPGGAIESSAKAVSRFGEAQAENLSQRDQMVSDTKNALNQFDAKFSQGKEPLSPRIEKANQALSSATETMGEMGAYPKTKEEFFRRILSGPLTTLDDPELIALSKKDPNIKIAMDRARDLRDAAVFTRDAKNILPALGAEAAVHTTFGTRYLIRRAFEPGVVKGTVASSVVKSPSVRQWIANMDAGQIQNNRVWQRAMRGIWPLGMSARMAMPLILQDQRKLDDFSQRIQDLKDEDLQKAAQDSLKEK